MIYSYLLLIQILNQSGLWGVSFSNYVIGNRFANNFNGMLYQEQGFDTGRGNVLGNTF